MAARRIPSWARLKRLPLHYRRSAAHPDPRCDARCGTDWTSTVTDEGSATIFVVEDHCGAECLRIHTARRGTRLEALERLRQGVRECFDELHEGVAVGLELRHDHGSAFVSDACQEELRFLGITSSPSYVREPEGNGCAERFMRTLKEQLLWLRRFATIGRRFVSATTASGWCSDTAIGLRPRCGPPSRCRRRWPREAVRERTGMTPESNPAANVAVRPPSEAESKASRFGNTTTMVSKVRDPIQKGG